MRKRAPGRVPNDVLKFRKALGRVIRGLRNGLGLSQEGLAAKLGLDQTTVAKAETGVQLWRLETWLEVSRALKVPFYDLFKQAIEQERQGGDMDRIVAALDPDEARLVRIWRGLDRRGRETLMERAEACLKLYPHDDNVVPLVREARGYKSKAH